MLVLVVWEMYFTHKCSLTQLTDIVQYRYTAVSNADLRKKAYRCNAFMILDELYQLVSHRSHLGHENSNFNSPSQNKVHLMHAGTLCADE